MRIVQINTFPNGSTGSIMMNIHKELLNQGHESYVAWGRGKKETLQNEIYMNSKLGVYMHALLSRITGKTGFFSKLSTKRLLKKIKKLNPDIIHLHNIHGYYINIPLLFEFIENMNIKVVWTFHDCWPITGKCPYFDLVNCHKWETQCKNCTQLKSYPKSFVDSSYSNYTKKKEIFKKINNLTIVTPSKWLENIVKKSYLKDKKIITINNGINTKIFKKTNNNSNFRNKYNLNEKIVILGVASPWTERKGLNDFIKLSKIIDEKYKIVLVGLTKKQIKKLPQNIIGIEKTSNVNELVNIYNSADVFFNPTYEDNYPTVNLEAISCGLPVITYNTGGSCESAFVDGINNFCIEKNLENFNIKYFTKKNVTNQIPKEKIDLKYMAKKYIDLYEKIYKNI